MRPCRAFELLDGKSCILKNPGAGVGLEKRQKSLCFLRVFAGFQHRDRINGRGVTARRGFGGGDIRRAMEAFGEENGGWTDGPPEENEMGEITEEWP